MSNKNKKRIAVLVSGGGSNLQSIIDNIEQGNLNCEISYVIADRKCHGLERAEKHGIKNILLDRKVLKEKLSDEISNVLENDDEKTDYIVLAGYLSILSPEFIKKWSRKIINIHPSLLPKFGGKGMYGMNVHRAVIEAKETESGCTIHFVDTGVDTGEIILQIKVPVLSDDTPEVLQKRVLKKEHVLLIEGIKRLLENKEKQKIYRRITMRRNYGKIKSLNLEKKTGSIEKIGNEGEKDFYFVEKELKGVKFEKLKEGQIVSFEPNISEKGNYANKIYTRIISKIKSLDFEKKRGYIEKGNSDFEKDFYFVEKELKGIKFEKLKEGQTVLFEPNISEKGSYANKIEVYVSNEKNFVKKLSEEIVDVLNQKVDKIDDPAVFEDFCFTVFKLLGIETVYQYPRKNQGGRADGLFKYNSLEVIYDCTLNEDYNGKEHDKKEQITNYTESINRTQTTIGDRTIKFNSNNEKQVWIITKGETKKISQIENVKVIEVDIRDIISIYGKKISELEYTRLQKDLLDLVKD